MQYNIGIKAFTVGTGGVAEGALVKLSSGTVVLNTATSTDDPVGVAVDTKSAADVVAVQFLKSGGSIEMIAAGAITSGAVVYAAASGKVQALPAAAATYRQVGIALEASTADGDRIEVLPYGFNNAKTVS